MQGVAVGGVLVLTLLVVAIGLSLAATESRDERDVLVAIGARPRTMRSLAGTKAVVMTLTGIALAIPDGADPDVRDHRGARRSRSRCRGWRSPA